MDKVLVSSKAYLLDSDMAKTALTHGVCPRYHYAVELIGRRWTGAILRMLLEQPHRFAELSAAVPDLSDRMLAERLRELEEEGIVARTVVPETPVRVEYSLTTKGRGLESSMRALGEWAEQWLPEDVGAVPEKPDKPRKTPAKRIAAKR
jgi:DNA-binding HxlR family transcriptional regulator